MGKKERRGRCAAAPLHPSAVEIPPVLAPPVPRASAHATPRQSLSGKRVRRRPRRANAPVDPARAGRTRLLTTPSLGDPGDAGGCVSQRRPRQATRGMMAVGARAILVSRHRVGVEARLRNI